MGLKRIFALIVLTAAVAAGLFLFSNNTSDQPPANNQIYSDSVAAPDRPVITASTDTHDTMPKPPPPVGEDFAPGTALIRANVLTVEIVDGKSGVIKVRVDEVMGYGPSTPPIPTETKLSLDVANLLKANPDLKKVMQKGNEIKALIASQRGMRIPDSKKSQAWAIIEIKQ